MTSSIIFCFFYLPKRMSTKWAQFCGTRGILWFSFREIFEIKKWHIRRNSTKCCNVECWSTTSQHFNIVKTSTFQCCQHFNIMKASTFQHCQHLLFLYCTTTLKIENKTNCWQCCQHLQNLHNIRCWKPQHVELLNMLKCWTVEMLKI